MDTLTEHNGSTAINQYRLRNSLSLIFEFHAFHSFNLILKHSMCIHMSRVSKIILELQNKGQMVICSWKHKIILLEAGSEMVAPKCNEDTK